MSLGAHFRIIWRRRWLVLLSALLVAGVVFAYTRTLAKSYQAQAQLSVTFPTTASTGPATQTDVLFYANTYAEIARTTPVVNAAIANSGTHIDEATAAKRISVSVSSTVGLLKVSATGPSPDAATRLVGGEADALIAAVNAQQADAAKVQQAPIQSQIAALTKQVAALPAGSSAAAAAQSQLQTLEQSLTQAQLQPRIQLSVVSPAFASQTPVSPKTSRWTLLAFVTALVVDSELAVAWEAVSDRFSGDDFAEDVRQVTGLPVLALISGRGATADREAFRALRSNLRLMTNTGPIRSCAVVSAESGVGKTRVAMGLAVATAEMGTAVTIVDANLRAPAVASGFGLSDLPGLGDVLTGSSLRAGSQISTTKLTLTVIGAGRPLDDPLGFLAERLAPAVLDALPPEEFVIVDTPAVGAFPDALAVAKNCDVALMVVDVHVSKRRSVRRTVDQLRQVEASPVGVIIRGVTRGGVPRTGHRMQRALSRAS